MIRRITLGAFFFMSLSLVGVSRTEGKSAPADAVDQINMAGASILPSKQAVALEQCEKNSPALTARNCLQKYWIPTWLLGKWHQEKFRNSQYEKQRFFKGGENRILYEALMTHLLASPWTEAEKKVVSKIQKELENQLHQPARIRIAHLYVHDSIKAEELQKKLTPDLSARAFQELCRQHSQDKSTYQSGGDLGFVNSDGTTEYPEIRVPTALYLAAKSLQDGEFSAQPITVPGGFSLIQRRGVLKSAKLNQAEQELWVEHQATAQIQSMRQANLLAKLRQEKLTLQPKLIDKLRIKPGAANHQPSVEK